LTVASNSFPHHVLTIAFDVIVEERIITEISNQATDLLIVSISSLALSGFVVIALFVVFIVFFRIRRGGKKSEIIPSPNETGKTYASDQKLKQL